jgi:catechol 2,3-dioxygenase-like lactoylglutathione lyase family enzyme
MHFGRVLSSQHVLLQEGMIRTLAHVCLKVADLGRTEAFYCGVLGVEVAFEFLRDGKRVGFYLRVGERHFLEFFETSEELPVAGVLAHFCFEVASVAAVRERLLAAGVEVGEPKLGCDGSWQIWCKDPDGVPIEFHEYTDKSSQRTGHPCVLK